MISELHSNLIKAEDLALLRHLYQNRIDRRTQGETNKLRLVTTEPVSPVQQSAVIIKFRQRP